MYFIFSATIINFVNVVLLKRDFNQWLLTFATLLV